MCRLIYLVFVRQWRRINNNNNNQRVGGIRTKVTIKYFFSFLLLIYSILLCWLLRNGRSYTFPWHIIQCSMKRTYCGRVSIYDSLAAPISVTICRHFSVGFFFLFWWLLLHVCRTQNNEYCHLHLYSSDFTSSCRPYVFSEWHVFIIISPRHTH